MTLTFLRVGLSNVFGGNALYVVTNGYKDPMREIREMDVLNAIETTGVVSIMLSVLRSMELWPKSVRTWFAIGISNTMANLLLIMFPLAIQRRCGGNVKWVIHILNLLILKFVLIINAQSV